MLHAMYALAQVLMSAAHVLHTRHTPQLVTVRAMKTGAETIAQDTLENAPTNVSYASDQVLANVWNA